MSTASLNKVYLIGNLGADPTVRQTDSGKMVANFSVCTNYRRGDVDKEEWHRVVAWEKLAERAQKYFHRGMSIHVEGFLQTTRYTDSQGIERWHTDVVAENIQMLGRRPEDSAPAQPDADHRQEDSGFSDVPF